MNNHYKYIDGVNYIIDNETGEAIEAIKMTLPIGCTIIIFGKVK